MGLVSGQELRAGELDGSSSYWCSDQDHHDSNGHHLQETNHSLMMAYYCVTVVCGETCPTTVLYVTVARLGWRVTHLLSSEDVIWIVSMSPHIVQRMRPNGSLQENH